MVNSLGLSLMIEQTITIGNIIEIASIVGGGVHILTGFDGSGTDTIDVGFRGGSATADPNGLATIMDLTNVGFIALDELAATTNIINTSPIILIYNYNDQNSDSTTVVAYISVLYTCGPVDGS